MFTPSSRMLHELFSPPGVVMPRFRTWFAALALSFAIGANAQEVKPDFAIAYRQSVFKMLMWNFAPLSAMVRGKQPFDAVEFAKRAERVAWLSHQLDDAFPPGSDQGAITEAKPDIWSDWDNFCAKRSDLQREAEALAAIAKGGDEAAMKAQFAKTAGTCKACHEDYKAD
jgi:cytochrome c556